MTMPHWVNLLGWLKVTATRHTHKHSYTHAYKHMYIYTEQMMMHGQEGCRSSVHFSFFILNIDGDAACAGPPSLSIYSGTLDSPSYTAGSHVVNNTMVD